MYLRHCLLFTSLIYLLSACGGAPGNNQTDASGGSNSGSSGGSARPSPITVNLEDRISGQEQETITITADNVSSSAGAITSYTWTQLNNGAPSVELQQNGNQVSLTSPNIRTDTDMRFALTVQDAAGNSATDIIIVIVIANIVTIDGMPFMYSEAPKSGEAVNLGLATIDKVGEIEWTVISQPDGSSLSAISGNQSSVTFTPDVPGAYTIQARSLFDNSTRQTTFEASPPFTFDTDKVKDVSSSRLSSSVSVFENQSWVSSSSLNETEIRALVDDHEGFTVIGFSEHLGLLLEYDEADAAALNALEIIRLSPKIDNVSNRIYEGESITRQELVPNDGGAFDDQGNNWHLEHIDATSAWDITTGSDAVNIGISDVGFNVEHEDISGRVFELFTNTVSEHGTRAVGAIGALSNNGQGITGVNWVSDIVVASDSIDGLQSLFSSEKTRVISNAWAIPGHIDSDFDPLDPVAVNLRADFANDITRPYRRIAQSNPSRLFVWPAGNGIDNGEGSNDGTQYGVNGRNHSPALHYDDKHNINKQANVLFTAAILPDNTLAYYSNFGESIDIAAPTSYQSTILNDSYDDATTYADGVSAYAGTSAATSVVAGVASLVYSLYPEFSGEEVKNILTNSAVDFVTERYLLPDSDTKALLDHPIPVVNAHRALLEAQAELNNRTSITYAIPDPFSRDVEITFSSLDANLEITAADWTLESSANGESVWTTVRSGSSNGDSVTTALDENNRYHRITVDFSLRNTSTSATTSASRTQAIYYNEINIHTTDTVSLSDLANVSLTLERIDEDSVEITGLSDANGDALVFAKPGSYKLSGTLADYQTGVTRFTATGQLDLALELIMSSDETTETGALSGFIRDEAGLPIQDAVVRISGGSQTNGFFAASISDTNGYYKFSNISKNDSDGEPIIEFLVEASSDDYSSSVRRAVAIVSGSDTTENLILLEPRPYDAIYSDDFESGLNEWIATGFWNQLDLMATDLQNEAVTMDIVSLPPNEMGPEAWLPEATSGAVSWWYGQTSTGSFVGEETSNAGSFTGGTSAAPNEGDLTSPTIDILAAQTPFLRFRTWWEIESVNPNSSGFDLLTIQVSTDDGDNYTTIKTLNPYVDPNDDDREHKGFTSGGFNRKPLWVIEEIDLSSYKGQVIQIRFNFDTRDRLYNGFRGWFIDEFVVGDYTLSSSSSKPSPHFDDENSSAATLQHLQFLKVHKQPQDTQELTEPSR